MAGSRAAASGDRFGPICWRHFAMVARASWSVSAKDTGFFSGPERNRLAAVSRSLASTRARSGAL